MAIGNMKTIFLIGIFIVAFAVEAQIRPVPVKPELKFGIRSPIVRVKSLNHQKIALNSSCNLTEQQRAIAWSNVFEAVTEKYPKLSTYCAANGAPTTQKLVLDYGVCHAYVACVKTVDGVDIFRGDLVVEVDETTQ